MSPHENRFQNSKVGVGLLEGKGRALFAEQDVAAGELIVSAPVLVLKGIEYYLMRILPCINHLFAWPRPDSMGGDTAAIAFGLASLCNHSEDNANAKVVPNFSDESIDLIATRPIEAGDEILIRYKHPPTGAAEPAAIQRMG